MKPFRYRCRSCGQMHEGMPSLGFDYPAAYLAIPEADRAERAEIDADACVIDGQWFYIRACIELPVHGYDEPFVWSVWVSISKNSFALFLDTVETADRDKNPPFFAWLADVPPAYPVPVYPEGSLKTMVHLRPYPMRPYIELEATEHPLAIEQRDGVSPERVAEFLGHAV